MGTQHFLNLLGQHSPISGGLRLNGTWSLLIGQVYENQL
jgi:hypothetical protein